MKSPRRGQPPSMHAASRLGCVLVLPVLGCLLGTDQLGEPDDTGTSSATGSDPADDDGMTGAGSASATSTATATSADGTSAGPSTDDGDDTPFDVGGSGCDERPCLDVAFGQDCDPWMQDCPPGDKCMPFALEGNSWNDLACFPVVDDPNGVGEPCTVVDSGVSGHDDCELGAMCWNVDPDTLEGTCVAQCDGSEDAPLCPPGTACAIGNEGVLTICLQDCADDAESCPEGEICVPFEDVVVCVPDGPNPGGYGEDCTMIAQCDPGLICIEGDAHAACEHDACCTPYCEPDGRPCPDEMLCELFPESEIGFCRTPV